MKYSIVVAGFLAAALSISSAPVNCQQSGETRGKADLSAKLAEMSIAPDENTVYKDESDKVISQAEFKKFLADNKQTYKGERVIKDGRVVEMKLAKLTPLEIEMMRKMREKIAESIFAKEDSVGKAAAAFTVKTLEGKSVSLNDLKGKIVVLNFWFIACAPCVAEMPELNKLVEKYRSRDDVVFLAPALDSADKLNEFLTKHAFKYQVGTLTQEFRESYRVSVYPTHIVIDRDGKIVERDTGLGAETVASVDSAISAILAGH